MSGQIWLGLGRIKQVIHSFVCIGGKMGKTIEKIVSGQTSLGIELGSTRIKSVLIDDQFKVLATGSFEWENQLVDGFWTYSLDHIWQGIQKSYHALTRDVQEKYGTSLAHIGSIGISAMMHGYLAFDQKDNLLVPFRTWRNANTTQAAAALSELFQFNIPERWSISHLYQAMLDREAHVTDVRYLTTLAGYVHWQLTGERVLGIGDASGMFPIDVTTKQYEQEKVAKFEGLMSTNSLSYGVLEILPKVLVAGEAAGNLTAHGAKLLDSTGKLQAGIPFCPPEGDAGTGMVATNSIAKRRGNVSAGTSAFAMLVLEKDLQHYYPEIDLVTTPTGSLVAMVHTNNCSSEINAWLHLFEQVTEVTGVSITRDQLFEKLFKEALTGDSDCGGLLSYGYHSGENITRIPEGRPLFVRKPTDDFTLANFMRMQLFSAFAALKIGMAILRQEQVEIDRIVGHGGIFKTAVVGQQLLAAAMQAPVTIMENAGEGGAWGIAVLASFLRETKEKDLALFLDDLVFSDVVGTTIAPDSSDVIGFNQYVKNYQKGLAIEAAAIEQLS